MCPPIQFLKSFNLWLMVFILIAAVYSALGGYRAIRASNTVVDNYFHVLSSLAGIGIAIVASISLCAVRWPNRCLLFISICLIGQTILLAYLASQSAHLGAYMRQDGTCQVLQEYPLTFGDTNLKTILKDAQILCTAECPCAWKDFDAFSSEERKLLTTHYSGLNGKSFRVQQCQNYTNKLLKENEVTPQHLRKVEQNPIAYVNAFDMMEKPLEPYFGALAHAQLIFNCTGMCGQLYPGDSLFYRFSHIQRGKPKGYCYPMIAAVVTQLTDFNTTLIGFLHFFLCVAWVFQFCICCHPERTAVNNRGGARFYDPLQRHED